MSDVAPEIEALFRAGATRASQALAAWLDRPALLVVERVDSLPLGEAVALLGRGDEPICGAAMQVTGGLGGVLLLAAADPVGLALADLLLGRPPGTSVDWGELERSALMETANIVACGYLQPLGEGLAGDGGEGPLPSPPSFVRDFPAAVMQAALVAQASAGEAALVAATEFHIDGVPTRCGLVFVPDDDTLARLAPAHARG